MVNLLSLSLLISSLTAAGFLSPHPNPNPPIREGHRIFVVEYERQVPPPSSSSSSPPPSLLAAGDLSENFKDSASDFSNSPKEKISSLVAKAKQKASQLEDAVKAVSEKAKDAGEEDVASRNSVHGAEATAVELEGNLTVIMRQARDLGRDVMVHVAAAAGRAVRSAAAVAHLFGFAIAFGTCVWVTFVSSHVLASALPREQFGIVQSRIYPIYFGAVAFSIGAAVAAFFIGNGGPIALGKAQGYNLLGVFGMVMVNMLYLEPRATKVMFERMKVEKEGVMGPPPRPIGLGETAKVAEKTQQEAAKSKMLRANKTLRRLNTYSSFLNVLSLMALSWHLLHLAQRLESSCN